MIKLLALLVLIASVSGCSSDAPKSGGAAVGVTATTMSFSMTDDPFPYEIMQSVNVTITSIAAGDSSDNFTVLTSTPQTVDFLPLRNGMTSDFGAFKLPEGQYTQIKIEISSVTIVLTDLRTFTITPATTTVIIPLTTSVSLAAGTNKPMLLDLSLSDSISLSGFDGQTAASITDVQFSASVKVKDQSVAGSLVGTVTGSDGMPMAGVQITAWAVDGNSQDQAKRKRARSQSAISVTGADGTYKMIGLEAGSYTLLAAVKDFITQSVGSAEVSASTATTLDVSLSLGSKRPDLNNSGFNVSPDSAFADGSSSISVFLSLADDQGDPVEGFISQLAVGGESITCPATDSDGNTECVLTSTIQGSKSVTVTKPFELSPANDDGGWFSTTVNFTVRSPDVSQSTFVGNNTFAMANGTSQMSFTLTLKDSQGNPVPNWTSTLTAAGDPSLSTLACAPTDDAGVASCTASSTVPGPMTITVGPETFSDSSLSISVSFFPIFIMPPMFF
jgi:protocatechuate 3,4-dioxygenase beta subunit